jgi:hypothetical protein
MEITLPASDIIKYMSKSIVSSIAVAYETFDYLECYLFNTKSMLDFKKQKNEMCGIIFFFFGGGGGGAEV